MFTDAKISLLFGSPRAQVAANPMTAHAKLSCTITGLTLNSSPVYNAWTNWLGVAWQSTQRTESLSLSASSFSFELNQAGSYQSTLAETLSGTIVTTGAIPVSESFTEPLIAGLYAYNPSYGGDYIAVLTLSALHGIRYFLWGAELGTWKDFWARMGASIPNALTVTGLPEPAHTIGNSAVFPTDGALHGAGQYVDPDANSSPYVNGGGSLRVTLATGGTMDATVKKDY